ncbi:MAG: hypothetical protein HC853_05845 [Anaerolineae bacterium]|nr:hypothetical protein [Anaerolineae bacterium]
MVRIGLALLGVMLVVGAFVGVLYLGVQVNPPPLRIAVATRDLSVGARLSANDYRIVDQIIDPLLARLYVQEADVGRFEGAVVVDVLRRGDPLNKIKLVADGDAVSRRYALALHDPSDVLMTLPVNADVIPSKILAGDFVNIVFAGGAEVGVSSLPEDHTIPPELLQTDFLTETAVASETLAHRAPQVVLPLADLMLERVLVLDVNHEQIQNPQYTTDAEGVAQPYIEGPVTC